MSDENKGGLSTTPEQEAFNADVLENHHSFNTVEEYIKAGQNRGAIPSDLTDAQKAAIAKAFREVKQS